MNLGQKTSFFDNDRFHGAGSRCFFNFFLKVFRNILLLGYCHIPLHFKGLRANLHTCFIPHARFLIDSHLHVFSPFRLILLPALMNPVQIIRNRFFYTEGIQGSRNIYCNLVDFRSLLCQAHKLSRRNRKPSHRLR